ncbi:MULTISPECIES: serine hydrolase [Myxococcus]|uniref:Beta-lactamase family protein n=1 Tax=Myxococcus llanfairpwllgwyngyllgogerychwyrndrobwllllantysiliogogogochensis TaxID=2590453 RepID=A0A540X5T5_9BACT|nr:MULTISPECIES: serine hydrolase domain-containing protein [Myxococcus]NTX05134.1 beta-lactamase family protein [Myxococcus sp. CA040A]TQF16094.1 beta-lactamase family protein [Myxococcus llanfairpwllgwyngyllgogerychwyrndrobwllllantysiliogogogochensis]
MDVPRRGLRVGAAVLVVSFSGAGCGPGDDAVANEVETSEQGLDWEQSLLAPLDRDALRQAIAGLPDAKTTAAQVRINGTAGRWLGASGVADVHAGTPVPTDARFRIGSITKTFTATVVLQLAAERRVDLDRPVQHYLPGLLPPNFGLITVRQLLNHTHGLPNVPLPSKDPEWFFDNRFRRWSPRELVALALPPGPRFVPGTQQEYGNIGYLVAGLLIEKVTGRPYSHAVRDRILAPLDLRDTSVPGNDPTIPGPHARGYEAVTKADGTVHLVDITEANQSIPWAAGEMISTTADLDTFLSALFRGRLLPPAQLQELFTVPDVPTLGGGRASYSAGLTRFEVNGLTLWGKSGDRHGYNNGMGATRDLRRRLVYSVNTLHMGQERPAIADRIVATTFAARSPRP